MWTVTWPRLNSRAAPPLKNWLPPPIFYTSYVEALAPEKMHAWLDCQVYIAVGFLLSAAAALRVDSCTIGGMDRAKYDEILGLDGTPYRSVVGVALGYRAKDDAYAREAKVRFPAGEVIDIRA